MKLTISKKELNESIQHVSKAITNRTSIPILGGIKMEANSEGMTLTASDTDISIQSFIPAEKDDRVIIELQREGSVVLPARFFVEMTRKLPEDEVEIEVSDQYQTLICSGSTRLQIVGMDPDEFPLLPALEENRTLSISSDLLKTMIRQTVFAVSSNESTPVLTGVLWTLHESVLKFVATDRHRLASRKAGIDTDLQFKNIVIAGKTMNELNKILPDQSMTVDIVVGDNQVLFKMDSILFYTRILDGIYPDTSKIIPQSYKTELVVSTRMLLDAIDRAYLLSREEKTNIVNLVTREDMTVEISSSLSELGKFTENCRVEEMNGEPIKISFNSKYMLDALKAIDSDKIHVGFTGSMSPIIIKPLDHDHILHLILPYRTSG